MSFEILRQRVEMHKPRTIQEEENAIKEVYQEIALSGLARSNFFKVAAFQGGACLRIFYRMNRFSEDLDFCLLHPNKSFTWEPFLDSVKNEFATFGIELEVSSQKKEEDAVRHATLKDSSFVRIFHLRHNRNKAHKQKILIKFKVDTNPPEASGFETLYLDFPFPFSITVQNKFSLFAGKCHALLCRPYVKGRDWYDFLWYVSNRTTINFSYLQSALVQTGHWNPSEVLDKEKFIALLEKKIKAIDWKKAANDVVPLLKTSDQEVVPLWDQNLFLAYAHKLSLYI